MPFLSDSERKELHSYSYKGGDSSPIYAYILSPLAQYCVDNFVPHSVAPNVITLSGLIVVFVAFTLTLVFNPNLDSSCPRWLCYYTGIGIFVYQTLDNMDGKQARRTQTSSPLGMLFDHGCDAINSVITPVSMASCIGYGWSIGYIYFSAAVFIAFYFQTWEHYYLSEMVLPCINGPSEGLLILSFSCILSGILSPSFWSEFVILDSFCVYFGIFSFNFVGLTAGHLLIGFGLLVAILTSIDQVMKVIREADKLECHVVDIFFDLSPFLIFSSSAYLWIRNSSVALNGFSNSLSSVLLIGSIFVDLVSHLMLMHICKSKLKTLERYFAYLIFMLPLISHYERIISAYNASPEYHRIEQMMMYTLTFLSALYTSRNLYSMSIEVAAELNIYIFSIDRISPSDNNVA